MSRTQGSGTPWWIPVIGLKQAVLKRINLQSWGGVGWVGRRLPPLYNSEAFLGWAPATPSFFVYRSPVWLCAVPLFALSSCRRHAKISLWLWGICWFLRWGQQGAPER